MIQQILNAIIPVAVTALVTVAIAAIKTVGDSVVLFIEKKHDALVTKIGADTYAHNLDIARGVWNQVDEYFRITPTIIKTVEAAQAKFTEYIEKILPGLTEDDIEHLRQAVAGEVNKGKEILSNSSMTQS